MPEETRDENNWRLRLQEFFDLRYVQISDYTLIRLLVLGCAGAILLGTVTLGLSVIWKTPTSNISTSP